VGVVLENELLEEEKRSLVQDLLPDLHARSPNVGRKRLGALGALLGVDHVCDFEALLDKDLGDVRDRILDGELDLDTARVRLGPDEGGVDKADLSEAPQLLEAQSQELARFGGGDDPRRGRQEPSVAVAAEVDDGLALDVAGEVDGELDAVVAEGAGLSVGRGTAVAAENSSISSLSAASRRGHGHGSVQIHDVFDIRYTFLLMKTVHFSWEFGRRWCWVRPWVDGW
jgi:hypothetical protein